MAQRNNKRSSPSTDDFEDKVSNAFDSDVIDFMVEQVKEDNEARQSDEEKSDTEDDVYTKSDVHLLNPKSTSKCGFQWVESPFRTYIKIGPYQRIENVLTAVPKQGHAYLSVEDCLNLKDAVPVMMKVFKKNREAHQKRLNDIVKKMKKDKNHFKPKSKYRRRY